VAARTPFDARLLLFAIVVCCLAATATVVVLTPASPTRNLILPPNVLPPTCFDPAPGPTGPPVFSVLGAGPDPASQPEVIWVRRVRALSPLGRLVPALRGTVGYLGLRLGAREAGWSAVRTRQRPG
jgi:hypothetical protein